jgi:hypothetical protein
MAQAQLAGIKTLQKKIDSLKEYAESFKEKVETKKTWLNATAETFQESDLGRAWSDHLYAVESILDDIENIDIDSLVTLD